MPSEPLAPLAPGDRVGFVGLGRMGAPMARRLVAAGYRVCGYDADASAGNALAGMEGGSAAVEPARVAQGARAVVLMLPDSSAVRDVLLDGGLLDALPPSAFVVDMGSSSPMQTRELAGSAARRGAQLIDAPVSGGVKGAQEGSLTIMVGGPEDVVAACRPLLDELGSSVRLVGPVGGGHALKALNNLLSAASMLATAEAVEMGRRFGLDPDVMLSVVNASSGRSWSTEYKFPRFVASSSYDSGFSLDLMLKDVRTALDVARATDAPAELAELVEQQWATARSALPPDADHTQIAQWVEQRGDRHP